MHSHPQVAQKSVLGPIKNKHLAPIGGLLSFLVPTLPLIAKSESVLAQQIDKEVRACPEASRRACTFACTYACTHHLVGWYCTL